MGPRSLRITASALFPSSSISLGSVPFSQLICFSVYWQKMERLHNFNYSHTQGLTECLESQIQILRRDHLIGPA